MQKIIRSLVVWGLFLGLSAVAAPREVLHLVYVTNRDRAPRADYENRLHHMMLDVQDFFRTEMARNGYGEKTFQLDLNDDGNAVVHLVTLDWDFDPARKFTIKELRSPIAESLLTKGIDIEQEYIVVFENTYWQDGETWKYDMVYTGVGDPVNGSTWVADHEWLHPDNMDPARKERINDRGQKLSIGQFNVKMIGGVAHEFGHGLGLPHNRETDAERKVLGKALMGAGNYTYRKERLGRQPHGTFLTRPHAFILSLHPLFNGTVPETFSIPDTFPEELSFKHKDGQLVISGRVDPAESVAGVVLYHDPLPTGTNKDYDAFSYLADMAPDGAFTANLPRIDGKDCALHLKIYFENGMHREFSFTKNAEKGLESMRAGYRQEQAKHACLKKDAAQLRALAAEVKSAKRFLQIAEQWENFSIPSQVDDGVKKMSLSSSRWEDASVGWHIPSFNGILDPDGKWFQPLETIRGKSRQGLYAHAPSNYTYCLGGKWKTLETKIGIQKGRKTGSVIFVVRGDGKELYRSPLTKLADGEVPVKVDLSGVQTLELVTEPGPDGKDADWGLWLAPTLIR
ncbi:NPCBM/NEW2 domain-containing protein [Pontiellaceae bacterium B12227]|nr:NPCBM/NEW2 domain-containing protein [Pontiellaceae bacterium B12227]